MKSTREHAERMFAHAESVMAVDDAAAVGELEVALGETADWILIQAAAVAGLRQQIATELEGIDLDRKLDRSDDALAREQRLVQLRRAAERARAWKPIAGEIPRGRTQR